MSIDNRTAGASAGQADATSGNNAVNPGMDGHSDLYARLTRTPKRGPASAMLTAMVGAAVLGGVALLVFTQGGARIHAEDVAAPPVATSAGAPH